MSATTEGSEGAPGEPRPSTVLLAFAAVYLVWGSTYLAIRFAIETVPPMTMAAIRFSVAGVLLYGWSRARGAARPTARQWRDAAIVGTLLLAGGNGAVVLAEQWVPSGLAALLVATVPLWLVILDALFGSRSRPSRRAITGLAMGFGGVALLTGSPGVGAGGPEELLGALLVLCGSFVWAAGSLYSRYATTAPRPRMWVGMQMLAGSVALAALALAFGEPARWDPAAISARSWWALAYLIVFGAVIGYTAYIWLLRVSTPARVGTYAYVNPVVALLLGWALAGEPLTFRSLAAGAIILGSVVVITSEAGRGFGARRAVTSRLRRRSA
jgi:drug/metabolite transporter (DMT)-like permease